MSGTENGDTVTSEKGIESPEVVDKYKVAADIANSAIDVVRRFAYAGMSVMKLCQLGDAKVEKAVSSVFNKARTDAGEKLDKGLAFPTCVSVNNCTAHFCPALEEESVDLAAGDSFTVQIGVHIDGYSAMVAATDVVRAQKDDAPVEADGRNADAMMAAWTAAQAALRVMRPGRNNYEVTDIVEKVAKDFNVTPMEGVLSHQVKRYVIDGSKVIMNRRDHDGGSHVDEWEFEENEVYAVDIVMSTGEGKAKEMNAKATVYKRQVDVDYKLKMKTSRAVFSEINKRFPTMPFAIRALEDTKRARLGLTEMSNHGLVLPYPVLYEREGQAVARVAMTVLILGTQTMPITSLQRPLAKSDRVLVNEEIKELLATSIEKKRKKKSKSKATESNTMETS